MYGFKGAVYKKFENLADAQEFLALVQKNPDKIKEDINEISIYHFIQRFLQMDLC